jgi:hypothetical protein
MFLVVLVKAGKAYKKADRMEYVIKKIIIITTCYKLMDNCNILI